VLLTGSSISHNPRALKEASALARAGYQVRVLGAWLDPTLKTMDQHLIPELPFEFIPVLDITENRLNGKLARIRRKSGASAHAFAGFENRWQLGYSYTYLKRAAFGEQADLYIAHSEPAMAVCVDLHRAGRRVGIDMEDWFSEDLLPEARRTRPLRLLHSLERILLVEGAFASCPSRAMSDSLTLAYNCPAPTVIYNAFAWEERQSLARLRHDRRDRKLPSIHWFSQTLGPGRGLEELFGALPLISTPVEIHLRGQLAEGFERCLLSKIPHEWHHRVFFHGLVPNAELLQCIAEHDIGFAGEQHYCRNKELTVSNKILLYLLAGLAVVASDTLGQREVADRAKGAVFAYPAGDARALAAALNTLLASPPSLCRAKAAALKAAQSTFCWERQKHLLIDAIDRSLDAPLRIAV